MSANTGVAPASVIACATWCQVCEAQITSSPGPMPIARSVIQVPSVPLPTATACWRPIQRAKPCSKDSSIGPSPQRPDDSTASTSDTPWSLMAFSHSAMVSMSMAGSAQCCVRMRADASSALCVTCQQWPSVAAR